MASFISNSLINDSSVTDPYKLETQTMSRSSTVPYFSTLEVFATCNKIQAFYHSYKETSR